MNTVDPIHVESENLLMEHSNTMHIWLMNIAIFYSIIFSLFSCYLNDIQQAIITLAAFPTALICKFLFKRGLIMISKLINILQTIVVITALCLFTGNNSFAFMYYFPLIIAALIIFKGKHKKWGYLISALAIILLMTVTAMDLRVGINAYNIEHQKEDQLSNIVGVCTACILLFAFSIKSTEIIQKRLLEKSREVQVRNEQLAATIYTRDKMMSVISHDLRSPIIALNSAMNIFSEQSIDPALQQEIVGQIKTKSNRLLVLIDELLSWTRSQVNAFHVNMEEIELTHIINYSNEQIHILGEEKSINLEVINQSISKAVNADKNMIDTIFRNLISNAIKFSTSGSKIQLSIIDKQNQVEFSIRDFGKGMTEKELSDFRKGITFSTSGTANEKGHGLGLQLIREFLHKQNSELYVDSQSGAGSRFYFTLSVVD